MYKECAYGHSTVCISIVHESAAEKYLCGLETYAPREF